MDIEKKIILIVNKNILKIEINEMKGNLNGLMGMKENL